MIPASYSSAEAVVTSEGLNGKDLLPYSHSLRADRLRASVSSGQLARGYPQFLATWASPFASSEEACEEL